ncbi:MAG: hypothetical protein QXH35_03575 [Nitrososphaerota archaeon]
MKPCLRVYDPSATSLKTSKAVRGQLSCNAETDMLTTPNLSKEDDAKTTSHLD